MNRFKLSVTAFLLCLCLFVQGQSDNGDSVIVVKGQVSDYYITVSKERVFFSDTDTKIDIHLEKAESVAPDRKPQQPTRRNFNVKRSKDDPRNALISWKPVEKDHKQQ
jgi:hypothetical protein